MSNGSPNDGYWKFTFHSNGNVSETYDEESASGSWKFDNPNAPTIITINHTFPPDDWENPIDISLLHLDADTLKVHDIFTISDVAFIKE